jgi:hypothetical protein
MQTLKMLIGYGLALTLVLGGLAAAGRYIVTAGDAGPAAAVGPAPEAPKIAAWRERLAEEARFEAVRQAEAAEAAEAARARAARPPTPPIVAASTPPAPRARIIESSRREEFSARKRRPASEMPAPSEDAPPPAPTYVGGLTAAHAAARDRSGD